MVPFRRLAMASATGYQVHIVLYNVGSNENISGPHIRQKTAGDPTENKLFRFINNYHHLRIDGLVYLADTRLRQSEFGALLIAPGNRKLGVDDFLHIS